MEPVTVMVVPPAVVIEAEAVTAEMAGGMYEKKRAEAWLLSAPFEVTRTTRFAPTKQQRAVGSRQ